jgi:hypothetical protein
MIASRAQARKSFFPRIVNYATWQDPYTTTNNATRTNVTLPSGIQAGDLIFFLLGRDSTETVNTPSGWTKLEYNNSYIRCGMTVLYKVASGGDTLSFTMTLACNSMTGISLLIRGANTLAWVTATGHGTAGEINPPAITPSNANKQYLYLALGTISGRFTTTVAAPSSFLGPISVTHSVITARSTALAWLASVSGSMNPGAFDHNTDVYWLGGTVALYNNP